LQRVPFNLVSFELATLNLIDLPRSNSCAYSLAVLLVWQFEERPKFEVMENGKVLPINVESLATNALQKSVSLKDKHTGPELQNGSQYLVQPSPEETTRRGNSSQFIVDESAIQCGSSHSIVPPESILRAFKLTGTAIPLAGGMGTSFIADATVLKPFPLDDPITATEACWSFDFILRLYSQTLHTIPAQLSSFRIPRPIGLITTDENTSSGWTATAFVSGHHVYETGPQGRWEELLKAGRAFHDAISHELRPSFIDGRDHSWAYADRVAWSEASIQYDLQSETSKENIHWLLGPILERLFTLRGHFRIPPKCQLVHGDLSGNVLFKEGENPAIIDFTPYWRPARYAEAVVIADAMINFAEGKELIQTLEFGDEDGLQYLVRALIFRLVSHNGLRLTQQQVVSEEETEEFALATEVLEKMIRHIQDPEL
jgi:hypothetical protein